MELGLAVAEKPTVLQFNLRRSGNRHAATAVVAGRDALQQHAGSCVAGGDSIELKGLQRQIANDDVADVIECDRGAQTATGKLVFGGRPARFNAKSNFPAAEAPLQHTERRWLTIGGLAGATNGRAAINEKLLIAQSGRSEREHISPHPAPALRRNNIRAVQN